MFPDELEKAFAERPVIYFPYGICEPHGPQNTLGLDSLKAHALARATARSFGGIVAPVDYWHVHEIGGYARWAQKNVGEVKRKWLTAVPPWVHFRNVCYHIRTADVLGFHAAIFITGHYGPNWEDLKTVLDLAQPYTKTRMYGLPDFEANQPGFDRNGKSGGDHAGKVETSLLWALDPDCVDLSRIPEEARGAGTGTGSEAAVHAESEPYQSQPREGEDVYRRPPYFAMGRDATHSNRLTGERMVRDEVAWLSGKASELLEAYDPAREASGFQTFEDVEAFWRDEIVPRVPSFRSMAADFGMGPVVDRESVWFDNSSTHHEF